MKRNLIRKTALATLLVQFLSPLSVAFTPAIASAAQSNRDTTATADVNDNQAAARLARAASRAGTFLSNAPDTDAAASLASASASGYASAEVQQWLSQFGTARTTIDVDKDFSLKGSSLDLLVPLHDSPDLLTFAQGGIRRADDRTQSSLGLGVRSFGPDSMLGASAFIDHDLSRSHTRAGLGIEYWRDNLRLGANSYMRLSGWKDSPDVTDYLERPANGWDITARGWLPSLPQLGASLGFERYYGEEVGLFGHSNRQKDPYAATAGLNWTPFPLLTLNAGQRQGKGSASDSRLGLELRYTPGVSWTHQTSPDSVAALRSLSGARHDLVERNSNIVLEYKKKEVIFLKTQEQVTGYAGEQKPLSVEIKSRHPAERIEWQSPELEAAGGIIMSSGPYSHAVILPAWQPGRAVHGNTYTVRGVAVDSRGNRSAASSTRVVVSQAAISPALSGLSLSSLNLVPDGTSAQKVTLTLRDAAGNPVDVDESEIVTERSDNTNKNAARAARGLARVGHFVRISAGSYDLTVTPGTEEEHFTLTPYVRGYSAGTITVNISQTLSDANSSLVVGQPVTDTDTQVPVMLTLRDEASIPINGQKVRFSGGQDGVTFSDVQESAGGVYTATMRATRTGVVTVSAIVNGIQLAQPQATVTVKAGSVSQTTSTLKTDRTGYASHEDVVLTLTLKDASGNSVTEVDLASATFTGPGLQEKEGSAWTQAGGVWTRTFTATRAGTGLTASVTLGDRTVTSAAYTITAGAASAANSTLAVSGGANGTFTAGDEMTVTFTPRDAQDNPATITAETADTITVAGAAPAEGSAWTQADGVWTRTFTATTADTGLTAGITLGDGSITSAAYTITAGAASAANSTLAVSGGANGTFTAGDEMTVTFTPRDAQDNPATITAETADTITVAGAAPAEGSAWTQADGVWTRTFTATTADTGLTASVTLGDRTVTSAAYTITAGAASAANSTLAVSGGANGTFTAGDEMTVTFTPRDAQDNPATITAETADTITVAGAAPAEGSAWTQADGVWTRTFTATTADTGLTAGITLGDGSITSAAYTITAGAASAANSTLAVSGGANGTFTAGDEMTVTFTPRDAQDNPATITAETADTITVAGAAPAEGSAWTQADGVWTRTFTATTADTGLTAGITLGDGSITSAAYTITAGAASAANSTLAVSGGANGTFTAGDEMTVTFTPRDAQDNPATITAETADTITVAGAAPAEGSAWTQADGVWTRTFTATTADTGLTAGITLGDGSITSAAYTITAGAASAANSTLAVSGGANGTFTAGDEMTVTFTPRDAQDNPATITAETADTITVAGAAPAEGSAWTQADGVWTRTFTATTADTGLTASVTLGDRTVTSAAYTITAGAASAANSTLAVSGGANGTFTAGDEMTVTFTPRDAQDNPATITAETADTITVAGAAPAEGSAWTQADGVWTRTFTATTADTGLTASVTLGDRTVTSAAYTITAGAASAANSTLAVSGGANGTFTAGDEMTVTFTPRDAQDNPATITAETADTITVAGAAPAAGSAWTQADGVWTRTFTATTADTGLTAGITLGDGSITSAAYTITAGAASAATSTLVVSGNTFWIGDEMTVTFTPRDAFNNPTNIDPTVLGILVNLEGAVQAEGSTWTQVDDGVWTTIFIATTATEEGAFMTGGFMLADGIILSAPYTITAGATN
ncbi:inverse autotransporter beta domain-containing protein [Enterobacter asburiae]|uniref:inverse autotransporter beta domain-containing protein n=1 Tax=Enterobacter asburiae TaxID=61645 RepID=UPI001CBAE7D0|nr:inverse autotransporter beta domain-containing protein [Enterobacter asburiae]UAN38800.1 inverse autotransporter beta domain-containing protein [Enterobacter asburiae]